MDVINAMAIVKKCGDRFDASNENKVSLSRAGLQILSAILCSSLSIDYVVDLVICF